MAARPNILLIVTDEERNNSPRPDGFSLPARERLAASGVVFDNYYGASVQCSSARSVMYTGQHVPITQIFDNDNMPYIRPLDPALGTVGTMLRAAGYYCTGELRPNWTHRGFLRAYIDQRHTFGRYFSPLEPNRPRNVDELYARNDVVLYDRDNDPNEMTNLAGDAALRELIADYSSRLESLIDDEIGADTDAWVTDANRPHLLGWPTWRGDTAA